MSNIEESYNIWAEQYDTNHNKTRDLDHYATVKTLDKYSFSAVLELGCGTGKNTAYLRGRAMKIIGFDFSQEMLTIAQKKHAGKHVSFFRTDITEAWDIPDDSLDLVTSSLVLEHIQELEFIFSQASKKLKKNGLFFICELHPFKQYTGSKARFPTESGIYELTTYVHHFKDYLTSASNNGFTLVEANEWFDEQSKIEIPRLVSFVFEK